ncbi:hypothetical protein PENSPDRAFT_248617 [Peniophora sp. CONT]|nr:hypothetical protein PENSPDRAFT_248617 [Peniophora sp. CONT]
MTSVLLRATPSDPRVQSSRRRPALRVLAAEGDCAVELGPWLRQRPLVAAWRLREEARSLMPPEAQGAG